MYIVAQVIGIMAVTVWVLCIQMKDKKKILELQIVASIFYAIQYLLVNAVSAGVLEIVSIVRIAYFYKNEKEGKENSVLSLILLNLLTVVVIVIFYQNIFSLLPLVIGMLYTFSTWQKDTKIIRICFLIAAILWIIYNVYFKAYAVLIGNFFEVASGVISILRFGDLKRKEKTSI